MVGMSKVPIWYLLRKVDWHGKLDDESRTCNEVFRYKNTVFIYTVS